VEELYPYAVTRIRAKELFLLTGQDLEQLMTMNSEQDCLRALQEKGWGDGTPDESAESLLRGEEERLWRLMRELLPDLSVFRVFFLPTDYNNLKAAVKAIFSDRGPEGLLSHGGTVEPQTIWRAVQDREYSLLPEPMRSPAKEALDTLLHTQDGQLCDVILDRAALMAIRAAGEEARDPLLREYSAMTVAFANIKTAYRSLRTGKSAAWMRMALVPCAHMDVNRLAEAAQQGEESLCEYLSFTVYGEGVSALQVSLPAFEKWSDNRLMTLIKRQKSNPFTVGPLAAYVLARQNEIKAVRLILSGKRNQLPETVVRERIRDTYV
jgi:V/A-type H+-transporting ATPase subunit C